MYDSSIDTLRHKKRVNELLVNFAMKILDRAKEHDASKLLSPEKEIFDEATPRLKELIYGTKEYLDNLETIKPAVDHHRSTNAHHPEHNSNGIVGMTLVDLVEMFYDWKASSERHETGSIEKSLEISKDRFKLSDQLYNILKNSLKV